MHIKYSLKSWSGASSCSLVGRTLLLVISLLIYSVGLFAQGTTFRGRVLDPKGAGLEYASVAALSLPDSAMLKGATTRADGSFELSVEATPKEGLLFRVSLLGYETVFVSADAISSITLAEMAQSLEGVEVRGKQKAFSHKGNNLVCNVAGTPLMHETDFMALLGKLPGFYRLGGELKTISKGEVKYFINNRPASLEEVNRLNVADIKAVELDHNPGSRFSGEVGTVVFVRLHRRLEGLSGFARSFTRINHRFSQALDGEVRYMYKNIGFTLGAGYGVEQEKNSQNVTLEKIDAPALWRANSWDEKLKNRNALQRYTLAVDYSPFEGHDIRLNYVLNLRKQDVHMRGLLSLWEGANYSQDPFDSRASNEATVQQLTLYYKGQLSRRWALELSADWYKGENNAGQVLTESIRRVDISSESRNRLWGIAPRLMYSMDNGSLQFGVDWGRSNIQSETRPSIGDVRTSSNEVKETKRAAYAEYKWYSSDQRWNLSLGLRYEQVVRDSEDRLVSASRERFTFRSFLPSVSLVYAPGAWGHQLSARASSSYPSFGDLSRGDTYINRFLYTRSNPHLERSIRYGLSYALTYKWLYLSAEYGYTHRPIVTSIEVESFQGGYRGKSAPHNIDKGHDLAVMASASPQFGFYQPQLSIGYKQRFMKVQAIPGQAKAQVSKPFVVASLSNSFSLPKDWVLGLDLSCTGAGSNYYWEFTPASAVDLSVRKYFFDKTLQISLEANDIFMKSRPRYFSTFQGTYADTYAWLDNRNIRLNIRWTFNKHKTRRTNSSISSEVGRL